ncbi:DUF2306 domain-containing protein [Promicromonospora sp. NPDC050249]|uniref:DUF2306 domain-containing protein n=1 Tax=Promicromonospora sp. NPDC050249 TaxID=3154743 RepID=UPI0033D29D6E
MTNTPVPVRNRRRWWWALWAFLAVSAAGFGLTSPGALVIGGEDASLIPIDPDVAAHFLSLVVHGVPGGLALLLGPFQFVTALRVRYPVAHRAMGRIYLVAVVVAAVASLYAATVSLSGFSIQVAFYLLATAWLFTAAQAYRTIRRGEVQLHRIWMIRNYALTFTAVSLRVFLLTGTALMPSFPALEFEAVYDASGWAAIVVNVMVAEYLIIQRTLAPLARRKQPRPLPRSYGAP